MPRLPDYDHVVQLAEESHDPRACMLLGHYFYEGGQPTRGLRYFEDAAASGSVDGAKLAAAIHRGTTRAPAAARGDNPGDGDGAGGGVPRCGMKARQYLRVAAELGDYASFLTLGEWYLTALEDDAADDELELDAESEPSPITRMQQYRQLALEAWEAGAAHGEPGCARRLGDEAAREGDRDRAARFWEVAAAAGDPAAIRALSHHHAAILTETAVTPAPPPSSLVRRASGGGSVKEVRPRKLPRLAAGPGRGGASNAGRGGRRGSFRPLLVTRAKVQNGGEQTTDKRGDNESCGGGAVQTKQAVPAAVPAATEAGEAARKFAKYARLAAREHDGASVLSLASFYVTGLAVLAEADQDDIIDAAHVGKAGSGGDGVAAAQVVPGSGNDSLGDMADGQVPAPKRRATDTTAGVGEDGADTGLEVLIPRDPATAVEMYVSAYKNCGVPATASLTAAADILLSDTGVERDVEKAMELRHLKVFVLISVSLSPLKPRPTPHAFILRGEITTGHNCHCWSKLAAARAQASSSSTVPGAHTSSAVGGGISIVTIADAFRLGEATRSGRPDPVRAFELYREAAGLGDPAGHLRLGDCLR
ncbi:hypothetical protein HK405_011698, partial [Cladochytrium tenue]